MEKESNNNKKSFEKYGRSPRKDPHSKQTSVSAKQKIGVIRRLTRDCTNPRDVCLVGKWLAILGHTNKDEVLGRDYLLELIHHQLRDTRRLSSPFTKLESYRQEVHSVLREVGRQQLRRLGLLKRQSMTALRVPKPSRVSLIVHNGQLPKSLASKEPKKKGWRQRMQQLDELEAKYRREEKRLRDLELASAAAPKYKETRRTSQKQPMCVGKDDGNLKRLMILERKERERKERKQRECEREHQRLLRAERQRKEKEILVSNRALREKEHRERSRTVQERREHERQLIESRKEKLRQRELRLRLSERGERNRQRLERNHSGRQLQGKQLHPSTTSQKSCWLCKGRNVGAEEGLGLRIQLDGWMCAVCQQHVRLDAKVVRSCGLELQKKLQAENANDNDNNRKRAKGERERQQMQELKMEMEKSHMMEWMKPDWLERSSDEESSAGEKAGKDEERLKRCEEKDSNLRNVKSDEKQLRHQRPTDVRESQNMIHARTVLQSVSREGQLEREKRKELTIRWQREIKRKEVNGMENNENISDNMAREEELEWKEPEKKEELKGREIMKKWSSQEGSVKEGAPKRCIHEDIISQEYRPQTQIDTEEQLDRRREMQWDLLLKILESEKKKRRHQSQESVKDGNDLKRNVELERDPKYDTLEGAQKRKELRARESEERRKREEIDQMDANGIQANKKPEKRASLQFNEEARIEREELERKEHEKQKLMIENQLMKACPMKESLKKIISGEEPEEEIDSRRNGRRAMHWYIPLNSRHSKEAIEKREEELRDQEKQNMQKEDLRQEEMKIIKRREGAEMRSREELQQKPVRDRRPHEEHEKLRENKEIHIKRSTDLEGISRNEKIECEIPENVRLYKDLEKLKNDMQKDEIERKTSENQREQVRREQERIMKEEGQKNRERQQQFERKENQIKTREHLEKRAKEPDRAREQEDKELRLQKERNMSEERTGRATREVEKREQQLQLKDDQEFKWKEQKEIKKREQLKSIAREEQREKKHALQEEGQKRDEDESQRKLRNGMKTVEERFDGRVMENEFERGHGGRDKERDELDERGGELVEGELKMIFMELEQKRSTKEIGTRRHEGREKDLDNRKKNGKNPDHLRKRCGNNGDEFDDEFERIQVDDSVQQFEDHQEKTNKEELECKEIKPELKRREKIQKKLEDVTRKDWKRFKKTYLKEKLLRVRAKEELKKQLPGHAKGEMEKKGTNEPMPETVTEEPNISQTEAEKGYMEVTGVSRKTFQGRDTGFQQPKHHSSSVQVQGEEIKLINDIHVASYQRLSCICLGTVPADSDHMKYGKCTENQAHTRPEPANDSADELHPGINEIETKRMTGQKPHLRTLQSISGNDDQAPAKYGSNFETQMEIGMESKPRSSSSFEYFAPRPSISQNERWVRFMETDKDTSPGDAETCTDVQERPEVGEIGAKSCIANSSWDAQHQDAKEVVQQLKEILKVSPPVSYCTRTGRKRFRPELTRCQLNCRKRPSQRQERRILFPTLPRKGEANENQEELCRRLQSDNALMESKLAEAMTSKIWEKHIAVSMMRRAANVVKIFQLGMRNKEPKPEETSWTDSFGEELMDDTFPCSTASDLPTTKLRRIIHCESQREVKLPGRIFQTISKAVGSHGGQLTASLLKCTDTMDASLGEHLRRFLNSQFEVQHVPDLMQLAEKLEDQERSTATKSLAETCRTTRNYHQQHWKQFSDHFIGLTQKSFSDHCDLGDELVQEAFQNVLKSYTAWSTRRLANVHRF